MPDEGSRNVAQWKCLDIVEVLFRLSEITNLTTTVYNFFRSPNSPISLCPDIFFLGVVQISVSFFFQILNLNILSIFLYFNIQINLFSF